MNSLDLGKLFDFLTKEYEPECCHYCTRGKMRSSCIKIWFDIAPIIVGAVVGDAFMRLGLSTKEDLQ